MHEPTHAPGWRGRPRRFGPIEASNQCHSSERLARTIRITCYALAIATVLIAGYAWAADAIAGHINHG